MLSLTEQQNFTVLDLQYQSKKDEWKKFTSLWKTTSNGFILLFLKSTVYSKKTFRLNKHG